MGQLSILRDCLHIYSSSVSCTFQFHNWLPLQSAIAVFVGKSECSANPPKSSYRRLVGKKETCFTLQPQMLLRLGSFFQFISLFFTLDGHLCHVCDFWQILMSIFGLLASCKELASTRMCDVQFKVVDFIETLGQRIRVVVAICGITTLAAALWDFWSWSAEPLSPLFVHGWACRLQRPTRPARPPRAHPELFPPSATDVQGCFLQHRQNTGGRRSRTGVLQKRVRLTSSNILVRPAENLLPAKVPKVRGKKIRIIQPSPADAKCSPVLTQLLLRGGSNTIVDLDLRNSSVCLSHWDVVSGA